MERKPLHIVFLWHMHQPYYGDKVSGKRSLPWVRLHGIKDYYPMAIICEKFPAIQQNFNLTPCLLEQLDDYVRGEATDSFHDLTVKPASLLTTEDKDYILSNFFLANWERMVKKFPRYEDLLCKRGKYLTNRQEARERFSTQDFLDLQVLFNLSWFHSLILEGDKEMKRLKEKGRNFSEEDKEVILRKEKEVISSIVPLYKRLQSKGQIEITTSPYYHPILPLLCNAEVAKVALPDLNLPFRFSHPEDAEAQVEKAVRYHSLVFGSPPGGMWPSEGSVSEDIIPLVARAGIKWIASDEDILSLSAEGSPHTPYQPYRVKVRDEELSILFRDRTLSDLIGFTYQSWPPKEGVKDLISRLRKIKNETADSRDDLLVTIILDGENPWEYYPDNGREFLLTLFEELSGASDLETVRVSQYLKEHPPERTLARLFPGSWVNHNFYIWIGHEQDQMAWNLLRQAREVLVECQRGGNCQRDKAASAWEELYIAEGSDWCWWYGADHSSTLDEEFDRLYREHLSNVYRLLGKEMPEELSLPLTGRGPVELEEKPVGLIHPILDGMVSDYYEWKAAGICKAGEVGGTMHRSHSILKRIYYGFDLKNVYLRIDHQMDFNELPGVKLKLEVSASKRLRLELAPRHSSGEEVTVYAPGKDGKWVRERTEVKWGFGQIMELALPFEEIRAKEGELVSFFLTVWSKGKEVERWPKWGKIAFRIPGPDYESGQWYV